MTLNLHGLLQSTETVRGSIRSLLRSFRCFLHCDDRYTILFHPFRPACIEGGGIYPTLSFTILFATTQTPRYSGEASLEKTFKRKHTLSHITTRRLCHCHTSPFQDQCSHSYPYRRLCGISWRSLKTFFVLCAFASHLRASIHKASLEAVPVQVGDFSASVRLTGLDRWGGFAESTWKTRTTIGPGFPRTAGFLVTTARSRKAEGWSGRSSASQDSDRGTAYRSLRVRIQGFFDATSTFARQSFPSSSRAC